MSDVVRDDILGSITDTFGIKIYDFLQIEQGYLNLKWKIETDVGSLFVKQYNKTRYPESFVNGLEISLIHQSNLHNEGIPTPKLFSNLGRYVLRTPSQERFVLMNLCEGNVLLPGSVNENQAYTLGNAIGKMHQILNSNNLNAYPLHWDIRNKEEMLERLNIRWIHANNVKSEKTIRALEVQRKILDETDMDIFSNCERGWGHWDLFVDNLLFTRDSLSAILDFDRMHFVYPEFDISRPILSCMLDNGSIHMDSVAAFVKGYREYQPLTLEKLVRSVRLTWWKEAEWVAVEGENDSLPLKRFREENIWIGDNWSNLQDVFSNV
ncbi:phosphotransferase [Paenibacillus sp. BK720]|uniref:phosphotransferase n=1 Tax=Paenibacillus sp. BK720 TaxID=2587092 RepID=UPI001422E3A3|nr:phosphotransferase [Paenibacillus sp. BK720]NIK72498.1 homoserine kinase type II [Paenibacillus sp. BK720]